MANVKFSQFTTETDIANVDELVGFKSVGGVNTNVGIAPANIPNLGNADLTATAARTYTQGGNNLTFATAGTAAFKVTNSTATAALETSADTVKLQGIEYPSADGSPGQVMTTDGSGVLSFTSASGGVTVSNQGVNKLVACSSTTDVLDGEDNLTFDGTELNVTGQVTANQIKVSPTNASGLGRYGEGTELLYLGGSAGVSQGKVFAYGSAGWVISSATSVGVASTGLMGFASGTDANQGMVVKGIISLTVAGTIGDVVYLNTVTGSLTTTPVSGTAGFVSRVMGYKLSADTVYFNPSQDWIEISL